MASGAGLFLPEKQHPLISVYAYTNIVTILTQ